MIDWLKFGPYANEFKEAFVEMDCPLKHTWFNPKMIISKRVKVTIPEEDIIKSLKKFDQRRFGGTNDRMERKKFREESEATGHAEGWYRVGAGNDILILADRAFPTMIMLGDEAMEHICREEQKFDFSIFREYEEHFRTHYDLQKAPSIAWYGPWLLVSKKIKALMEKDKAFEEGVWKCLERYSSRDWGDDVDIGDWQRVDSWCSEYGRGEGWYVLGTQKIVIATDGTGWPTIILLPEER